MGDRKMMMLHFGSDHFSVTFIFRCLHFCLTDEGSHASRSRLLHDRTLQQPTVTRQKISTKMESIMSETPAWSLMNLKCDTLSYITTLAAQTNVMESSMKPTAKQGQYLAFIYYYTKLNRQPPARSDMQWYFKTSPPTVHNMVVTLCDRGFISREPGRARTIKLLVDRDAFPDLE